MYSILRKELRFRRTGMLWWFVGMMSMALMIVAIYPSMASQLQGFELPDFYAVFGATEMYTLEGFLGMELYGFMVPLVICIYALVLGTGLLGGEEDDGTLELLLALPVRRWKIVVGKALSLVILVAVPLLGLSAGAALGLEIIESQLTSTIELRLLLLNALAGWPLALVFGFLGLWLGAYLPDRSVASAVGVAIAVVAYFLDGLAEIVPILEDYGRFSPMRHYDGLSILRGNLDWGSAWLLLAVAAVLLALALWSFSRRNVTVHAWPWQRNRRVDAD